MQVQLECSWPILRVYLKNAFRCNTIKDGLPKKIYDAKRLVSKLGLEAKRIDCCVNGRMLYYNNDGALIECKFCNKLRYRAKTIGTSNRKPVPIKAMFYLPIIPRL